MSPSCVLYRQRSSIHVICPGIVLLLDTETSWVMPLEPFNSTVSVHSKIWLEHISSLPSGLAVKKLNQPAHALCHCKHLLKVNAACITRVHNGQCSIHHCAVHTVAKSMANNCRGQSKIAQRLRDEATTRQTEEMQMRSDDRMTHRLALMAKAKGSQQGKGSHTDKGRGAREARPCTACAHALRGRPLPFSTCLEGQPSMGATEMTGNSFPRAQPIGLLNIHKIHNHMIGLVVKVSEGFSRFCVWCSGVK